MCFSFLIKGNMAITKTRNSGTTEQRNRLKCGMLFRVPERRNNGTSLFIYISIRNRTIQHNTEQ